MVKSEKAKEYDRKYYLEHCEQIKAHQKEYYQKIRDKKLARMKAKYVSKKKVKSNTQLELTDENDLAATSL